MRLNEKAASNETWTVSTSGGQKHRSMNKVTKMLFLSFKMSDFTLQLIHKGSYQGLDSILLLHLLPQLLEAGFQAVMERPQRFRDLVSVDADPLGKVRNLRWGGIQEAGVGNFHFADQRSKRPERSRLMTALGDGNIPATLIQALLL